MGHRAFNTETAMVVASAPYQYLCLRELPSHGGLRHPVNQAATRECANPWQKNHSHPGEMLSSESLSLF